MSKQIEKEPNYFGIAIALVISGLIISLSLFFTNSQKQTNGQNIQQDQNSPTSESVYTENGAQIIEIKAKGGYSPRLIEAKANKPTKLRVVTENTFDCSLALIIPELEVSEMLPMTGITEFELPNKAPGSELVGMCSMGGMYYFKINFI